MKESLTTIVRKLNFTPTERKVVLFLVGAFLFGLCVRFVQLEVLDAPGYDYSGPDREFRERAAQESRRVAGPSDGGARTGEGSTDVSSDGKATVPGRVDLNRSTKEELMTLPGVGETIAERIILYRDEHGPFTTTEDLLKVKGIGRKKLDRIAPFCAVKEK